MGTRTDIAGTAARTRNDISPYAGDHKGRPYRRQHGRQHGRRHGCPHHGMAYTRMREKNMMKIHT